MSPALSKGTYTAIEDLNPGKTLVVSPVKRGWPMRKGIDASVTGRGSISNKKYSNKNSN